METSGVQVEPRMSMGRSPRWSSGNPRMLLVVLVHESESRRGELLSDFAKNERGSTAESA